MTCLRSVISQRPFKLTAEAKWAVMTAVLPVVGTPNGTPNDTSINNGTDTPAALVDTYLKVVSMYTNMNFETLSSQRCMALARHLGTPEFFSYFKAALQAAMEKTEAVARQSSAPLDSSEVISILVNCLVHEFNKAKLVPQLMEAVETVWSDEGSPSSLCGRAQDVMGRAVSFVKSKLAKGVKTVVPAVLLSEVLGLLPLASGAPTERGDEVTEVTEMTEAELCETDASTEEHSMSFLERVARQPFLAGGAFMFDVLFFYALGRYMGQKGLLRPFCPSRFRQDNVGDESILLRQRYGPDQFIFLDNLLAARWGTRWYPLPDGFEWNMTEDVIKSKALMIKDGRPVVSDDEVTEVPYTVYEHTAMSSDGTCPLWTKIPEGYHKAELLRFTSDGQAFLKFEDVWYKVNAPVLHDGNKLFEGPCFYKDEEGHVVVEGFARYEVPLEMKAKPLVHQSSVLTLSDTVSVTSSVDSEGYQTAWSAIRESDEFRDSVESLNSLLDGIKSLSPGQSGEKSKRDASADPSGETNSQIGPDNGSALE